jgi:hypothetical protein
VNVELTNFPDISYIIQVVYNSIFYIFNIGTSNDIKKKNISYLAKTPDIFHTFAKRLRGWIPPGIWG